MDYRQVNEMQFCSTTVLYARGHLGEAAMELSRAGYAGIELQPHHTRTLLGSPEERARFRELLADHDLDVAAIMSGYLWDQATLAAHVDAVGLAAELGCDRIVVLPPQPSMADLSTFQHRLLQAADVAAENGIVLAVHHHAGTVIDTPARIEAFLDWSTHPAIGLCLDTAHYALFADDEADAVLRFGERISHVHLKDLVCRCAELSFVPGMVNGQQSFRVPGDGVLDLERCIEGLQGSDYRGWVSVELENFNRGRSESLELALKMATRRDV